MSAALTVSATMGVMDPLLAKLAALTGDEYRMLTGVRKQVSFLEKELSAMKAALEKMELMDDHQLDPQAKNWRDHVREMSYDMEDCVDDFTRDLGGAGDDANAGFVKKITLFFQTMWASHQIGYRIGELKVLVLEANERRLRYKIDDCINSAFRAVPVDPRMSAIYKEESGLVGIDGPKKEVVSWLTDTEKKLKVVSIVGFGGLGKTTLAKQVYDEIQGQFCCKAFVPVSQRPDMAGILNRLKLKFGMDDSSRVHEVQDIIDELRVYLANKRYLIVLDDLWDQSAWNTISCAFVESCTGSRVIVTTRVEDVARNACQSYPECVYRMEPLKYPDSRKLFFNRVFGSEDDCPSQLQEVSAQILKKCGGLPLAIVTIASLLASHQARSRNEWESIRNSLGGKFSTKPTLEEMMSILNLSYMHLPLHLQACFLYLAMYPEDHEIKRDDLVRQWIAEGFVNHLHGSDSENAAKSYFNELINRSMIQPAYTEYGEVLSFRVHDMMLDLILRKCAEDHFISVVYRCKDMAIELGREYKVRRLCLNFSNSDKTSSGIIDTSLSQVRSFAQFGESKYTPPFSHFRYLRVLVFELPDLWNMIVDLTSIGQLFQLRYVKVSAVSGSIVLPTEIQGLALLETLEIYAQSIQSIPSDMVLLSRLSRLVLRGHSGMPTGIKNTKSLRTLDWSDVYHKISAEDLKGLGELTNLTELSLVSHIVLEAAADALVSSIAKLRKLRSIALNYWCPELDDSQLYLLSNPPFHIEKLDLRGWPFKRVPKWIGDLHRLWNLDLSVVHLSTAEVHLVGKLPSLVKLHLWNLCGPADGAAIKICAGLFPVLEVLGLFSQHDDAAACMQFEAGGMPNLQELTLRLSCRWGGATPLGMEHLSALKQIHVDVRSSIQRLLDAKSAFRSAAEMHPRRPSVTIY